MPSEGKKDYFYCFTEFFSWFLTRENNQLRLYNNVKGISYVIKI